MTTVTMTTAIDRPTHQFDFDFCIYKEFWVGKYPYDRHCLAQLIGLDGEIVRQVRYSTNINPISETDADYYRRWAKNYIPANATVDDVIAMWTQRGKSVAELMATLNKAIEAKKAGILSSRRPLFLYKRKGLRNEWRKIYKDKKECKRFLANPGHLLQQFMTDGVNYLPGSF